MKPSPTDIFQDINAALLNEVLTVTEVRLMWEKSQTTIMFAIWRGELVARQTVARGIWLISKTSVIALWGEPTQRIENVE